MNPLDRFRILIKALANPKELIKATVRPWEIADTFGRRGQREAFDLASRYQGYVKVAVSRNASAVAMTELKLYRKKGRKSSAFAGKQLSTKHIDRLKAYGSTHTKAMAKMADDIEEVIDPDHPIKQVLRKANPYMSGFDLMEYTDMLQSLAGTFYWICTPGPQGWPTEIWAGFPQWMRPIASQKDLVDHYVYGRGQEVEFKVDRKQVITFKRPNPTGNPYYGVADLATCLVEADLSAAFARFALTMLDRGAQPGVIITAAGLDDKQREELEARVNRKFDGIRNAGRSMVIAGNKVFSESVKVERWESAAKEAGYLAGQSEDTVLNRIAAAFDVPVGLIKMEETSVANGRVAAPHWQLMSIAPKCRRIEETLNEMLVPMFHDGTGDNTLFLAFENPVHEDKSLDMDHATKGYAGGIITKNEARELVDMPPVDGGDEFMSDNAADPETPTDEAEAPDDGDDTPALDSKAADVVVVYKQLPAEHKPETIIRQSGGWFDCGCDRCAPRGVKAVGVATTVGIEQGFKQWLQTMLPYILASINDDGSWSIDLTSKASRDLFYSVVGKLIDAVFVEAFAETTSAMNMLGRQFPQPKAKDAGPGLTRTPDGVPEYKPVSTDLFVANPKAEAILRAHNGKVFDSVSETASKAITESLAEGVANGDTIPELKARVRAEAAHLEDYQAERIARTEASKAFNNGREQSWIDSGLVVQKEWLLAPGACPLCVAIQKRHKFADVGTPFVKKGSTIVADGKTYVLDYEDIQTPPAHPNDRCSVGAVFIPEIQERRVPSAPIAPPGAEDE